MNPNDPGFIPDSAVAPPEISGDGPLSSKVEGFADVFMLIAIVMLASSLAVAGGMFAYKRYLLTEVENDLRTLDAARNRLDEHSINKFKITGKQLEAAKEVLQNHVSVSKIFKVLEELTLKSVRYKSFDYKLNTLGEAKIALDGEALTVNALAWQSKVMGKQRRIFRSLVFSDLDLDQRVGFKISAEINPDAIKFENVVVERLNATGGVPNNPGAQDINAQTNMDSTDTDTENASTENGGATQDINATDEFGNPIN